MRNNDQYKKSRRRDYQALLQDSRRITDFVVTPRAIEVATAYTKSTNPLFGISQDLAFGTVAIAGAVVTQDNYHISFRKRLGGLWNQYGIVSIATLLIAIGVVLAVLTFMSNMTVQEQAGVYAQQVADSGEIGQNAGSGSCESITDSQTPKHITIHSLDISACITVVGVNRKGNIGSPASIKNASWYNKSSSPVDNVGSTLVVGHVGTDKYPGLFAQLYKISKRADIVLTMGDGKIYTYLVTDIKDIDSNKLDMGPYLSRSGSARVLHLITCTGDYNARTHSYTHRLIVTAVEKR